MKVLRYSAFILAVFGFSACAEFKAKETDAVHAMKPAGGSAFTQALANEYRSYADWLKDSQKDYADALTFARKGLAAGQGNAVLPEPIADWNEREAFYHDLNAGRNRLIGAFDRGARDSAPALAAKAQAKFDCWIERQEENWKEGVNIPCKNEFMNLLGQLEAGLPAAQAAPEEAPMPVEAPPPAPDYNVDASAPMKAENAMYLVFFDWDKATITPSAESILDAVAAEVAKNPPQAVDVVGHADTSGSNEYNDKLSSRRAAAVKTALVKRGVNASIIQSTSRGEHELLVQTPDNVREPSNRRANISFK